MNRTHGPDKGHEPNCFGCKLHSIQFGNVEPPGQRVMEHQWNRDLPAYARLRAQGYQPKQTRGCAELETRATQDIDIEMHKIVDPGLWRKAGPVVTDVKLQVEEGVRRAKESGLTLEDVKKWRGDARKKAS